MFIFPLLCALLPFLFFIIVTCNLLKRPRLPPGPHPWPVIGNIIRLGKKRHVSLANLARSHGQLMSLQLGGQLVVIGSSPAAAIEIFRTHDRTLSGRYVPAAASKVPKLVHSSISLSEECNERWNFLRSICHAKLFSAKAVESQSKLREKKMREMVDYLGTREGQVVKLSEIVFTTLTNSLSNILISEDLTALESGGGGESERMKALAKRVAGLYNTPHLADMYPVLHGVDFWCKQKANDLDRAVKLLWTDIIKARRERSKDMIISSPDLLDALIENSLCDDNISFLFTELMTAGTHSTCSTIEWTMAELIKNQAAMVKLRNELEKSSIGGSPSSDHDHLPYLQACIKEAMRLHPPAGAFLIPHRALETCKVMDYTIPKDSILVVNTWAIGTDPLLWDDHLSFKPERFLDHDDDRGLGFRGTWNFQFLPFSAGRRMCPGFQVAVNHIQPVVASLVHYFDWFLPLGMDPRDLEMTDEYGITMKNPLPLIPRPRKHP